MFFAAILSCEEYVELICSHIIMHYDSLNNETIPGINLSPMDPASTGVYCLMTLKLESFSRQPDLFDCDCVLFVRILEIFPICAK